MTKSNLAYYVVLLFILLISYFNFAPIYSAYYNSDNAVHVLMGINPTFKDDLYYWGQKRLGSLIPYTAYIIRKVSGLSPIISSGIALYSLMILGFLLISNLLKSKLSKISVALITFFPTPYFIEFLMIGHPYCGQFLGICIGIYAAEKIISRIKQTKVAFYHLLLLLFSFILSIWSSELSIISVLLISVYLVFNIYTNYELRLNLTKIYSSKSKLIFQGLLLLIFLFLGLWFLYYAKSNAYGQTYGDKTFVTFPEAREIIKKAVAGILDVLLFGVNMALLSISSILILIFYISTNFYKSNTKNIEFRFSISFILLSISASMLLLTILSNWVLLNQGQPRYYSLIFILFLLSIVFYSDSIESANLKNIYEENSKTKLVFKFQSFTICLIIALNSYVLNIEKEPSVKQISEFSKIQSAGIISNYWYSYFISSVFPETIISTPSLGEFIRRSVQIPTLLKKSKILLIKNDFPGLTSFPDSIFQFGRRLIKIGEPSFYGNFETCEYLPTSNTFTYFSKDLASRVGKMIEKDGKIYKKSEIGESDYICFGQYIGLMPGEYTIDFYVEVQNPNNELPVVELDICKEWGTKSVYAIKLKSSEFIKDNSGSFKYTMKLKLQETIIGSEFRIRTLGNAEIYFEKVQICAIKVVF